MAQSIIRMDQAKLSCSICLDLLKDPVTIPCGHSYCMNCIKDCWDNDTERKPRSCPQCRERFTPRPVLVKNTILAELVEELKAAGLQAALPGHFYAGPEDIACDYCTERKLKAVKSCLVCMASYCEQHLQPHHTVAPLKKHKLVAATSALQENICPLHDEVMKIFCRSDQKCICYLCSMDDHQGHIMVSTAAERLEKQTELEATQQKIKQRVNEREEGVKVIQQRVDAINHSADAAVKNTKKIFTDLIRFIEQRSSEVEQQIRSQQETEVSRAKELEEELQQEISELRRQNTGLQKLSETEDHLHFLKKYPSLSHLSESNDLPSLEANPQCSFSGVTVAVSEARDKLQALMNEESAKMSLAVTDVDVLPLQESCTRAEFLKYSCQITLDPNTAHTRLSLSNKNRKATLMEVDQSYLLHPDRFMQWWQVLSKEGLTGRCYWEVQWSGNVHIAVAYKGKGMGKYGFGYNNTSWSLDCYSDGYKFRHNSMFTFLSGPPSSRIGVYLDHRAGSLSFYGVSETMTLLHRVKTMFTQPLYAGFWLPNASGNSAELCELM